MKKIVFAIITLGILISMFTGCSSKKQDAVPPEPEIEDRVLDSSNHSDTIHAEPQQKPEKPKQKPDITAGNKIKPIQEKKAEIKPGTGTSDDKPEIQKPATKSITKPITKPIIKPSTTKPETTPPKPPADTPQDTPPVKPDILSSQPPSSQPSNQTGSAKTPESEKKYSIHEVYKIVKNVYENDYSADSAISKEMLGEILSVDTADIEVFIAEQAMTSTHIDAFIAIKATSGKGSNMEKALERYKENLTSTYPSNIQKAKAAQVVRHEDYVFLVMLGAHNPKDDADEAEKLRFAKEQVQKGIDAINHYFAE